MRAINAYKRTNKPVLILTYNITLKNYIKDKIAKVKAEFPWNNFIVLNYHYFINMQLNKVGGIYIIPPPIDYNKEKKKNILKKIIIQTKLCSKIIKMSLKSIPRFLLTKPKIIDMNGL